MSTHELILRLITPTAKLPSIRVFTPVVDVARATVAAITAKTQAEYGQRKRILLNGELFSFKEAVDYIADVHPELKPRINKAALEAPPLDGPVVDLTPAVELFGLKVTSWKQALIEAVDELLRFEKEWEANGVKPYLTKDSYA